MFFSVSKLQNRPLSKTSRAPLFVFDFFRSTSNKFGSILYVRGYDIVPGTEELLLANYVLEVSCILKYSSVSLHFVQMYMVSFLPYWVVLSCVIANCYKVIYGAFSSEALCKL